MKIRYLIIAMIILTTECSADQGEGLNTNDIRKAVETYYKNASKGITVIKDENIEVIGCKDAANQLGFNCDYILYGSSRSGRFVKSSKGLIYLPE